MQIITRPEYRTLSSEHKIDKHQLKNNNCLILTIQKIFISILHELKSISLISLKINQIIVLQIL